MKVSELMEILKNCNGNEIVKLHSVTVKKEPEAVSVDIHSDDIVINS